MFGGALTARLIAGADWIDVALTAFVLLIARPVTASIALIDLPTLPVSHAMAAFFRIRGIGTFYYIAFVTNLLAAAVVARPEYRRVGRPRLNPVHGLLP